MANRYSASTGMNTRRNMTRVGRPTRAAGAVRTRASRTGRGSSTRMRAGRMGSSSIVVFLSFSRSRVWISIRLCINSCTLGSLRTLAQPKFLCKLNLSLMILLW